MDGRRSPEAALEAQRQQNGQGQKGHEQGQSEGGRALGCGGRAAADGVLLLLHLVLHSDEIARWSCRLLVVCVLEWIFVFAV